MDQAELVKMTDEEWEKAAQARKQAKKAKRQEKIPELRKRLEEWCQGEGFSLSEVFMYSQKPAKAYKCPSTGAVWHKRGKRPEGLKGLTAKDLEQYALKAA